MTVYKILSLLYPKVMLIFFLELLHLTGIHLFSYMCSIQVPDVESREDLIKNHYMARIVELTSQLQLADSKSVHFYAEVSGELIRFGGLFLTPSGIRSLSWSPAVHQKRDVSIYSSMNLVGVRIDWSAYQPKIFISVNIGLICHFQVTKAYLRLIGSFLMVMHVLEYYYYRLLVLDSYRQLLAKEFLYRKIKKIKYALFLLLKSTFQFLSDYLLKLVSVIKI